MPISLAERLTDQQLQILSEQWRPAAVEILALRARVAKLEAALKDVRIDFEMWHETTSIAKIDAALKDAPQ